MIYFTEKKLACKGLNCCGNSRPQNPVFENKLDNLRHDFGAPLYITSGFRCNKHNKDVGGVKNSLHTKMRAADLTSGKKTDLQQIEKLARKYFREVIVYFDRNFVHVGDE